MRYYGKIFGALLGFLLMRHPIGILIGGLLGHAFDAGWLAQKKGRSALDDAYATLGVEADATEEQIDLAYRQNMSKYHPDKVAGAAQDIRSLAEERARALNAAYDLIRKHRG